MIEEGICEITVTPNTVDRRTMMARIEQYRTWVEDSKEMMMSDKTIEEMCDWNGCKLAKHLGPHQYSFLPTPEPQEAAKGEMIEVTFIHYEQSITLLVQGDTTLNELMPKVLAQMGEKAYGHWLIQEAGGVFVERRRPIKAFMGEYGFDLTKLFLMNQRKETPYTYNWPKVVSQTLTINCAEPQEAAPQDARKLEGAKGIMHIPEAAPQPNSTAPDLNPSDYSCAEEYWCARCQRAEATVAQLRAELLEPTLAGFDAWYQSAGMGGLHGYSRHEYDLARIAWLRAVPAPPSDG